MNESDRVIAVVSDDYLSNKTYSKSERLVSYWESPTQKPFLIPVVVKAVADLPILIKPLKRIHLHGMVRDHARDSLISFLNTPHPPLVEPPFPGVML